MEQFITILKDETAEVVEKKSKFIANICFVETVEEAEEKIKFIKKQYHDARHNCVAYRVAENGQVVEKSSDDGEPSGTAGGPMLNILQKNNLCNVVVIVTRYFGGIKLGTGGLTRAYSGSVAECLNKAKIANMQQATELKISSDYEGYSRLLKYLNNSDLTVIKTEFSNNVEVVVAVKNQYLDSFKSKIIDVFNGKIDIQALNSGYYDFE